MWLINPPDSRIVESLMSDPCLSKQLLSRVRLKARWGWELVGDSSLLRFECESSLVEENIIAK